VSVSQQWVDLWVFGSRKIFAQPASQPIFDVDVFLLCLIKWLLAALLGSCGWLLVDWLCDPM
jgi:hypothetical protein